MGREGSLGKSGGLDDVNLGLIVASHLGSVQDHSTGNVGVNSTVESSNTLVGEKISSGLGDGRNFLSGGGHHLSFEDVERVSGKTSNGTGGTSGSELLVERGSSIVGSEHNLDGFVKTKTKRSVRCFTQPSSVDSLPESDDSLVGHNLLHGSSHTKAGEFGRDLNTGLDDIDRVDETHLKKSKKRKIVSQMPSFLHLSKKRSGRKNSSAVSKLTVMTAEVPAIPTWVKRLGGAAAEVARGLFRFITLIISIVT